MYEIIIRKIEGEKVEEEVLKGKELVVAAIDPEEGTENVDVEVLFYTSVDNFAKAVAMDGHLRASARIGVAYHEAAREARREEENQRAKRIMQALSKAMGEGSDEGEEDDGE